MGVEMKLAIVILLAGALACASSPRYQSPCLECHETEPQVPQYQWPAYADSAVHASVMIARLPLIMPPQDALETLVDELFARGRARVPAGEMITREYVRIFYHIELEAPNLGFWGAYIRIFHTGPGKPKPIFEIDDLGPGRRKKVDDFEEI